MKLNLINSLNFNYFNVNKNTALYYEGVTDVYDKLIRFCISNGFKVSDKKYYFIQAKKNSWLPWNNMRLDLEIQAIDKAQVKVTFKIYRLRIRQKQLENKYIKAVEKFVELPQAD